MSERILVTGAGGFIGHHLVNYLVDKGYWVRGVDIKEPEFEPTRAQEFQMLDLRRRDNCLIATRGIDEVYNLAADMGGIGYITAHHARVATNNVLINAHLLEASLLNGISRFFFSSSACIYPMYRQKTSDVTPLREEDAYPAEPEEGYGWEKLYTEKLCEYYTKDHGLETRVGAVPQRVRPPRNVRRGAGEGAHGDLPESRPGAGRRRDRDLGRRQADAVVHVRGRLRGGDPRLLASLTRPRLRSKAQRYVDALESRRAAS